jgi:hypothetical protein
MALLRQPSLDYEVYSCCKPRRGGDQVTPRLRPQGNQPSRTVVPMIGENRITRCIIMSSEFGSSFGELQVDP